MATSNVNFEKFSQEAHEYLNGLAEDLGHPDERNRVLIIWRSVMHCIRDRIHLGESFQVMAPLPVILRGIYAENWKYSETKPKDFKKLEEMKSEVKNVQARYGEEDFPWQRSTEEIIAITLHSLKKYMKEEQLDHIIGQMPKEIRQYLSASV